MSQLLRQVGKRREGKDIDECGSAGQGQEIQPALTALPGGKEWSRDQEQGQKPEERDSQELAVDPQDFRRDVLERLKHENEVPLGFDACRGRGKGIRLL